MASATEIVVSLPGGRRVNAEVGRHIIHTDQPISNGGEDAAPAPFDVFLASMGACAGIFVQGFCAKRGIAYEEIRIIERPEYNGDGALRAVDFIKRHVFPGSFIPSISAMLHAAARSSDLKLYNLEDIGPSYALTLAAWRERFHRARGEIRALGHDERFLRLWDFYFAYCEGGFRERSIGDVQMLLVKPGCRREQFLPDEAA